MAMEEAAQVGKLDERRHWSADFVARFAKFRRDPRQVERGVERGFGRRRHKAASLPQCRAGEIEARLLGVRRQCREMRFTPRGLHQHRAEILRRRDNDLHAAAAREAERGPTFVVAGNLVDARHPVELPEHLFRRNIGDEHRHEFADDLAPPADFTRGVRRENVRQLRERLTKCFCFLRGVVRQPPLTCLAKEGDPLLDLFCGALAEARQRGEPPVARRFFEVPPSVSMPSVS